MNRNLAQAYSPGLKRKEYDRVRRSKQLPLPGRVLVSQGEIVQHDHVVAETSVPGSATTVNAASFLGLEPEETREGYSCELKRYMIKHEGETVKKGETVARRSNLFGLIKMEYKSPIDGSIELISDMSGQLVIREPPVPVRLRAHIPGKVVEVMPNVGLVIETPATYIQGIFGIGGETEGLLRVIAKKPGDITTENEIPTEVKGEILVCGSIITSQGLHKAVEAGAAGVIVGGIDMGDLTAFLGYDIGVAITGNENAGLTLIVTEGFGEMQMSETTFELLKKHEGHLACIDGSIQIRAGVVRPEIVVPVEERGDLSHEKEALDKGMKAGLPVRIVRAPYFGALGRIRSLPVGLQTVDTESTVRVMEVELGDGRIVVVPRANAELIEE